MKVENLTPDTCTLTTKQIGAKTEYVFDFGAVKRNNPATFKAKIENVVAKSVNIGCKICTTAKAKQVEQDVELEATYDAKATGKFTKPVTLNLADDRKIKFILTGTVV